MKTYVVEYERKMGDGDGHFYGAYVASAETPSDAMLIVRGRVPDATEMGVYAKTGPETTCALPIAGEALYLDGKNVAGSPLNTKVEYDLNV